MRRVSCYTVMTFLILVCEFCFAKYLSIGASVPMLTFLFVIISAMHEKNRENALILGLLVGAVYDIMLGHGFGTYTIIFGITAWETASLCDSILSSRFIFLIINTVIMTIFAQLVFFLFHIIEIGPGAFSENFTNIILPTALYNTVVAAILYKPIGHIILGRR